MRTFTILIANGPNLGHIGRRQPEIYGSRSLDDLPELIRDILGPEKAGRITLEHFQSNGEGQLIDRLEEAMRQGVDGIVLNAGAYTHTSLALADCLAWIGIPCVEVHLSNILARNDEPLRHKSLIGRSTIGVIAGFGLHSYALGVCALWQRFMDTAQHTPKE
ncbi:3-dehydroquinate dehydratase ii [hydrocarbon metagenome]|uniref:3-dehydroquinate dehydratase n=1 Tax=hydrocarbon metagenome TaxID=938273 RepID=A0A0W8G9D1_9ZZZZ